MPLNNIALLDWRDENKEFYYDGKMYDVVRSEVKDGFIFYHCLNDEEEDKLFEHIEDLENEQFDNDRSPIRRTATSIVHFLTALNSITSNGFRLVPTSSEYLQIFSYSKCDISSVYREIFSPPPNFI